MKNVIKLIEELKGYAAEEFSIENDMVDMYMEDANDASKALELFEANKIKDLADHVSNLDTLPREGIVVAFAKDLGNTWIEANLGYSLR